MNVRCCAKHNRTRVCSEITWRASEQRPPSNLRIGLGWEKVARKQQQHWFLLLPHVHVNHIISILWKTYKILEIDLRLDDLFVGCSWTVRGTVLGDVLGLFLKCSCQCSWGCSCLFFKKKTLISQLFLTPTWNVLDTVLGIVLGPVIELFLSCSWTVIGTVLGAVIELFLLCSWACSWACSWFLVFFAWKPWTGVIITSPN